MLASKNTIPNVTTPEQGHHWLSVLSGELCVRLKEAREANPGLWPKTLVLGTRKGWTPRTRQLPFPYARELTPEFITRQARKLWDESTAAIKPGDMKFNNVSDSKTHTDTRSHCHSPDLQSWKRASEESKASSTVVLQQKSSGPSVMRACPARAPLALRRCGLLRTRRQRLQSLPRQTQVTLMEKVSRLQVAKQTAMIDSRV